MKKRTIISVVLMGALLMGCNSGDGTGETKGTAEESESSVQQTTETSEATETTETSETDPTRIASVFNEYDVFENGEAYELLRDYATAIEKNYDGQSLKYGFFDHYQSGDHIWLLGVSNGIDEYGFYASVNGEIKDVTEELGYCMRETGLFPYTQFMKLPCLINLEYVDELTDVTDTLEDGMYYGGILAVSEDAGKLVILTGDTVTFTPEEYENFKVGDVVYKDISVTYIDADGNITLSDPFMSIRENYFDPNSEDYLLMDISVPLKTNYRVAVISIDPDCSIIDNYGYLNLDMEGFDAYLSEHPDSTALERTNYWYLADRDDLTEPLGDNWTYRPSMLLPVVIENNTVVEATLDFR